MLKYISIAGLMLCAGLCLTGSATAEVVGGVLPDSVPSGSTPWAELGLLILFGSMSSFGWSRFVPESIGHDTERMNKGDDSEFRQPLGKYVPDDIFRFCVAMSSVELPAVNSPGPHVLLLAKGSELLGVRSAWAAVFDTNGGGMRRVAFQRGPEPAPDSELACIPLDQVPELYEWIQSGEPVVVLPENRENPATQEHFGDSKAGIGLLLPLRAGTEIVGFHYWLGIQNTAMVENPRVIALASASSVLAGRISSLRGKDKLSGASQELEIARAMGQFAGAETWNKNLPANLLKTVGDLCNIEMATLWLADAKGKQLRSVADLPTNQIPGHNRSRVLQVGVDGICGHAAASGEPAWTPDVSQDDRYVMHLEEVKAEFAVPLVRNGRLLGVLATQTSEIDGFSPSERRRIGEVASHAAEVLEYYNRYYGSQCEIRKLSALSEIGHTALTVRDAGALLDEAVKIIADNFGYPHVYVFLHQHDKDFLILRSKACHDEPALPLHFRAPLARGMVGFTGRTATTLLANDVKKESLYFPKLGNIGSELCVPILDGDQLLGVIDLMDRRRGAFLLDDMAMLEAVAELLALSIKRFQASASGEAERARAIVLERVLHTVTSASSPQDILRALVEHLQTDTEALSAYLLTRPEPTAPLTVLAAEVCEGQIPAFAAGSEFDLDDARVRHALQAKESVIQATLDTDRSSDDQSATDARYVAHGVRSMAIVPLVSPGNEDYVLLLACEKPGGVCDETVVAVRPWLKPVAGMLQQLCTSPVEPNTATDRTVNPENISEILGDILGRVQTLLMRSSGDAPGGDTFRTSLHEMEQSAAKAYEALQSLAADKPPTPMPAAAPAESRTIDQVSSPPSPTPKKASSPPATDGVRTILVVDDQENILDVVVEILTSEDHRVDTAGTAADAITKLQNQHYDIVFSDWSLDSGDAKPVIAAGAKAGIPVVVTTGWRGEVDEKSVHELGAKAILRKPFDVKKLLEAVYIYGLNPTEVADHD